VHHREQQVFVAAKDRLEAVVAFGLPWLVLFSDSLLLSTPTRAA